MTTDTLYTAFISERRVINVNGSQQERDILVVYYDVAWKQLSFYVKKHGATHVTVEAQSAKLGKAPTMRALDEIKWSAEATRVEMTPRKSGFADGYVPPAPVREIRTPVRPVLRDHADYADLVNVMVGGSA